MAFFNNKRRDFSIQPPRQQVDSTPFFVTDSANIDFTLENLNLTANLTTTGITAGTYGSSTLIPILTLDQYGRVTGVSTTTFSASGVSLETNGNPNDSQTILNLIDSATIQVVDLGGGDIEFNYIGTVGTGTVTSVAATVPNPTNPAFSVAVPNPTTTPSIDITANGIVSQYIRGDGSLANFPTTGGGGSSLNYYLNGSVSQGTLGGVAFRQMSSTPVIGAGTNFSIGADGYIESFITDASVPNQLLIPAGNWLFEMYFNASSAGGSPRFYIELYKLSGGTLSLIASSVANPEFITNGTAVDLYTTAVAVPSTVLLAADRIAVRVYVIHSGRTITLHTENSNLCEVITTFSTGITALNGLTAQIQNLATGTSGTDFGITSATDTHTFNLPTASALNRGALSSADWTVFNGKQDALTTTKSVKIITNNVELDGDEASPTARKFYSTSGAASKGWRTIEKLDLPTIISSGSLPYIEREYLASSGAVNSNGGSAIVKIPGSNVIFAAYTTGNTVVAYDTTTASVLSTTTVAGVVGLVYVASTAQVWAFGSTAASITRFTATTGASLGATVVLLLTASCRGVYDDSLVTGNVYAYNGSTMNVINASTYARTGVAIGGGTGSNELVLVTSGVQSGLLVGTVNIGVFGFNKSTNTLAYAPTTAFSSPTIKYIPSLNKIITVSASLSSIYVYTPATATTITLSSTLAGVFLPNFIDFDETENYMFVLSGFTGTAPIRLSIFDLTTLVMVKSMPLTAFSANGVGYIAMDKPNKCLYLLGFSIGSSINKIVYA